LCCGAGALGAAVAASAEVELHAADVDPAAVRCARRNLPARTVHAGDLWDALPRDLRGRVDVVVANAPYVPTAAIALMPPEARDHEPATALDGGPDGTDVHARLAAQAAEWLAPGGYLVVETGRTQAARTVALLAAGALSTRVVTDEDLDATVVVGRRRV
ncbi:methyltransferase, partial [Actinotalea sp. JY-7885]|uniref:methyltransferase n=2 Tax=unclassified Actinotalea TaxID=2638618 RepID=UPI00165D327A